MTPLVLRPRFVWAVLGVIVVATGVAFVAGAGRSSLVGVGLAAAAAFFCRQSLRIEGERVTYRGLFPSEDFAVRWTDVSEVVLDIVRTRVPGSPSSPVPRARFLRRDGPSLVATLFSPRDGDRVHQACREAGVAVVDER